MFLMSAPCPHPAPMQAFQNTGDLRKGPGPRKPEPPQAPSHGFGFWQKPCARSHNGWNYNLPQESGLLPADYPENNTVPIVLLRGRIKKKSNSSREMETLEKQRKVFC